MILPFALLQQAPALGGKELPVCASLLTHSHTRLLNQYSVCVCVRALSVCELYPYRSHQITLGSLRFLDPSFEVVIIFPWQGYNSEP